MTLFAVAFSPDKAHVVAGGTSGRVHVWRVEAYLGSDSPPADAHISFNAHTNSIYTLAFSQVGDATLLITGGDTEIRLWRWPAILEGDAARVGQLEHPRARGKRGSVGALAECNGVAVNPAEGRLFSAAGDHNAYAWDLATMKLTATFQGHLDYLHCVAARELAGQIVTGSEDGTAKLWDVRSAGEAATFRPAGGGCGWCSCAQVDASEDWLVCGWGAGVVTTWSLTAQTCTAAMLTTSPAQDLRFSANSATAVYAVGAESVLYEWTLAGTPLHRVNTRATSSFGVASRQPMDGDGGLVVVCGNVPFVDVFDASLGVLVCSLDVP